MQRLNYAQRSPELLKRFVAFNNALNDSTIEPSIRDLVTLRASQLNGCAFCVDMHVKEAKIHGERELRLHHVAVWRESTLFAPRERAALGTALAAPVTLADGGKDLYIQQDRFHQQFAADVSASDAVAMAAGQRPITEAALNEPANTSAWQTIPSWFIYGNQDRNIPAQALGFMAERAKSKHTEVIHGGSHVIMISNPKAVAKLIERATTNL